MVRRGPLMFHELAPLYDSTYAAKDYAGECRILRRLVRETADGPAHRWLDVACGTGRHLEILRRDYDVTGVDLSRDMLRYARARLRRVRLVRGDMRTFDLGEQFDVVTCLFSAIGHLRSERELARTFANFARHLRPGGVAIVEPWIDPRDWRPGHIHVVTQRDAERTIVRLATARRRGNRSMIHYHYLIAEPGREARYVDEVDVGLLVKRERIAEILRNAGFEARVVRPGFSTGRGLVVGRRTGVGGRRRPAGRRRSA